MRIIWRRKPPRGLTQLGALVGWHSQPETFASAVPIDYCKGLTVRSEAKKLFAQRIFVSLLRRQHSLTHFIFFEMRLLPFIDFS